MSCFVGHPVCVHFGLSFALGRQTMKKGFFWGGGNFKIAIFSRNQPRAMLLISLSNSLKLIIKGKIFLAAK